MVVIISSGISWWQTGSGDDDDDDDDGLGKNDDAIPRAAETLLLWVLLQVHNMANPPMVSTVHRKIVIRPGCPVGETVCSNGKTCSNDGFCGMSADSAVGQPLATDGGAVSSPPPVLKLAGKSMVHVKRVSSGLLMSYNCQMMLCWIYLLLAVAYPMSFLRPCGNGWVSVCFSTV